MVDIDKFIISMVNSQKRSGYKPDFHWLGMAMIEALKNQGLEYKDGSIKPIESEEEIEKKFKYGDVVRYVASHPAYSGLYLLDNPNDLSIGYSNAHEPYQIALRNCTLASEGEKKPFIKELEKNLVKPSTIKFNEPDIDEMVEDFILSNEASGELKSSDVISYRQGLEDMWDKLKK